MNRDLAIVASAGGMTCAYSVGGVLALKDLGITTPQWAIGSSGSTGTLAYMTSGQYQCFRNIWEKLLTVREFISFIRVRPIIDIDYLIDQVFKIQDPLDVLAIRKSPTELLMATTNCETGRVRYFSSREENIDIFEALRASKAMPFVYGKKVLLDGQLYFDGALVGSVWRNIMEAIRKGAKQIIVLDNNTHVHGWQAWDKVFARTLPKNVSDSMRSAANNPKNIRYPGIKIIHVTPWRSLPAKLLDNNSQRIRATIDIGYEDVMNCKEIKELT